MNLSPHPQEPFAPSLNVSQRVLAMGQKRRVSRERIHRLVAHPIDTPRAIPDPLLHEESRTQSTLTTARLLVAAIALHTFILVLFAAASRLVGDTESGPKRERLTMRIVETPKPPPPVEESPVSDSPPESDFAEPEPEPEPEPKPKPPPKKEARPQSVKTPPPPDVTPEEPQAAAGPRRIVGLSFESTVAGDGPAFALGDSRRGKTAATAQARQTQSGSGKSAKGAGVRASSGAPQGSTQRAATRIPTRDVSFERPRRLRPSKPAFPPTLKAQGIEADVLVKVDIDAQGRVTSVGVVRSSGHAAFDNAARSAAKKEKFAAAKRDGRAVPFTLTYTYRFRLD